MIPDMSAAKGSVRAWGSVKEHRDRGSRPRFGLHLDPATGPGRDRAHHGHAEPGAPAGRLGGEERVEDLVPDLGADPGPGVTNLQSRAPAGRPGAEGGGGG